MKNNYDTFWKFCGIAFLTAFVLAIAKGEFIGAGVLFLASLFCLTITMPNKKTKVVFRGRIDCCSFRHENNNCYFWTENPKAHILIQLEKMPENLVAEIEKALTHTTHDWMIEIKGKIDLRYNISSLPPTESLFYEDEKNFQKIWENMSKELQQSIQEATKFYRKDKKTIFFSVKGESLSFYRELRGSRGLYDSLPIKEILATFNLGLNGKIVYRCPYWNWE